MPAASKGYDFALYQGDIPPTGGAPITGSQLTMQRIQRRLATHKGESFADSNFGIAWAAYQNLRPVNIPVGTALIRGILQSCPGVARVQSIEGAYNKSTKTATFNGFVNLTTGESVQIAFSIDNNGNPALTTLLCTPQAMLA